MKVTYILDIRSGCVGQCGGGVCKNGGVCRENYTYDDFTCDCQDTSYLGKDCSEGNVYIRYKIRLCCSV